MPFLLLGRAVLGAADMTDAPDDPPNTDDHGKDADMPHDDGRNDTNSTTPDAPEENLVHFNPWRDFNDAAPMVG